jgi:hypothetical protein
MSFYFPRTYHRLSFSFFWFEPSRLDHFFRIPNIVYFSTLKDRLVRFEGQVMDLGVFYSVRMNFCRDP